MAPQKMRFKKKLTTKMVGLLGEQLTEIALDANPAEVPVMRIGGIIADKKLDKTQLGEYIEFTSGKKPLIEAINLVTGERFRSNKMLLPDMAEAFVNGEFEAYEGDEPFKFAIDVTVSANNSAQALAGQGTRYTWGASPVLEPTGPDMLTTFMESLGAPPMLAAPKGRKPATAAK